MNLLIENGILLKPYSLPWTPNGWPSVLGWTPERTDEMQARLAELQTAQPDAPSFLLWKQVEQEEGARRQLIRSPWPGWIPVLAPANGTKEDRQISRAYRELFCRMNEQYRILIEAGRPLLKRAEVEWPPDGRYVFDGKEMLPSLLTHNFEIKG